jgi:DNA-binding protein H-NS
MARMTPESLKGKIAELEKQLKKLEQNKAPAIRQVLALMKKNNLTIEDLGAPQPEAKRGRKPGAKTAGKAKGQVAVKYQDGQGNTWTGRGRTPVWLAAAEKAGRHRDEFKVAAADAGAPAV